MIVVFLIISLLLSQTSIVNAVISSCSASVSPTSVNTSIETRLTFTVENTSSQSIVWVKISRPSTNFTITSWASTWSGSFTASEITFTGGSISASSSTSFNVDATSGSTDTASENWTVQVSDDGGASSTTCSGSLGTAISGAGADTTAPTISDIVVSDVTDSSVKITWTTNESSDSVIDYGKTSDYGSTKSDSSSVTSHSISIDGLSANTTYHYNVKSKDSAGNTGESGNNTFATAKSGTTGTTQTGTTTTTTTATPEPTPKPTPAPDKIAPVISLDMDFDKPFKETPKITGKVTDRDSGGVGGGVSSVEYSIDDGKNWLPVDNIKNPGAKSTSFDFTPPIFEDGNYKVKVRTKDLSGNLGYSGVKILVVDRLPPQVGGVLFSLGPQILAPNKDGTIYMLVGLDQKITLSAVGGPIEVNILADEKLINLAKNLDNGLWSGVLNFEKPGVYQLLVKSVDGANNKTEKNLNTVVVLDAGVIKDGKDNVIQDAKVSLYYFEATAGQFVLWDGLSFGQTNPQKTDSEGKYKLLIPSGKYYLQISASGFKTLKTNIFTTDQTVPLNTSFTLKPFQGIQIGPFRFGWPGQQESVEVRLALPTLPEPISISLTGKEMPFFPATNDLKGKPTVVTFLSIWSPQTFEQLPILNELSGNKEVNTLAIMSQDTVSKVNIFKKIGGYKVPIVADPDGILVAPLAILNIPTHVFLDRKGIIKKVKVGVLNKEELLDNLVN